MEKVNQTDSDNLADIIWWIRGYMTGAEEDFNKCPFTMEHHESLRKVRLLIQDHLKKNI